MKPVSITTRCTTVVLVLLCSLWAACAAIKPIANAPCPANATCEAVDFGNAVTLTVCMSADDMAKLKALATERRDKLQAQQSK